MVFSCLPLRGTMSLDYNKIYRPSSWLVTVWSMTSSCLDRLCMTTTTRFINCYLCLYSTFYLNTNYGMILRPPYVTCIIFYWYSMSSKYLYFFNVPKESIGPLLLILRQDEWLTRLLACLWDNKDCRDIYLSVSTKIPAIPFDPVIWTEGWFALRHQRSAPTICERYPCDISVGNFLTNQTSRMRLTSVKTARRSSFLTPEPVKFSYQGYPDDVSIHCSCMVLYLKLN